MSFRRLVLLNSFVLLLLAVMLVSLNLSTTGDLVENEVRATFEKGMSAGASRLSDQLSSAKKLSLELCVSEEVQTALRAAYNGELSMRTALETAARASRQTSRYFSSCSAEVYQLRADGTLWSLDAAQEPSLRQCEDGEWMRRTLRAGGEYVWDYTYNDTGSYLRVAKAIYDEEDWQHIIGVATASINTELVRQIINSIRLGEQTNVYLIDEDGGVLFPYISSLEIPEEYLRARSAVSYTGADGGLTFLYPLEGGSFKLAGLTQSIEVVEKMASQRKLILITAVLAVTAAFLATLYISYRLSKPIQTLAAAMKQVENGDYGVYLEPPKRRGDMQTLYQNFNSMLQIRKQLIEEIYGAKLREKEAELRALQAQINPHFLYNTLDTISWMAMKYDAEDIEEMVGDLSTMFRYSLNNGMNILTVDEELKQIQSYLKIQRVRFSGSFEVEYDVDEPARECLMIKLLLQPLVENSLLHGFNNIDYIGTLTIRVKEADGMLTFYVINDGNLIDMDRIRAALEPNAESRPTSYGLRNVNDRLKMYYGQDCGLQYSINGIYSIAQFTIPAQRRKTTGGTALERPDSR